MKMQLNYPQLRDALRKIGIALVVAGILGVILDQHLLNSSIVLGLGLTLLLVGLLDYTQEKKKGVMMEPNFGTVVIIIAGVVLIALSVLALWGESRENRRRKR
jgi:drug/metabolite transporter (DMT)-like permease